MYTPLLPAVATGTVEERSIVEPIRRVVNGKVSSRGNLHVAMDFVLLGAVAGIVWRDDGMGRKTPLTEP